MFFTNMWNETVPKNETVIVCAKKPLLLLYDIVPLGIFVTCSFYMLVWNNIEKPCILSEFITWLSFVLFQRHMVKLLGTSKAAIMVTTQLKIPQLPAHPIPYHSIHTHPRIRTHSTPHKQKYLLYNPPHKLLPSSQSSNLYLPKLAPNGLPTLLLLYNFLLFFIVSGGYEITRNFHSHCRQRGTRKTPKVYWRFWTERIICSRLKLFFNDLLHIRVTSFLLPRFYIWFLWSY